MSMPSVCLSIRLFISPSLTFIQRYLSANKETKHYSDVKITNHVWCIRLSGRRPHNCDVVCQLREESLDADIRPIMLRKKSQDNCDASSRVSFVRIKWTMNTVMVSVSPRPHIRRLSFQLSFPVNRSACAHQKRSLDAEGTIRYDRRV